MIIIDVVDDEITTPVNQARLNTTRVPINGFEARTLEYQRACAYHRSLLEAAHSQRAAICEKPAGYRPADGRARWADALNRLASILAGWL
jgi:hypothetical protein